MKTTQKQRLQNHLDSGQSINRLSALLDLGIFELSARIVSLEKDGYQIHKDRTTITNRFGESISVVVYSKKTNDADRLFRLPKELEDKDSTRYFNEGK